MEDKKILYLARFNDGATFKALIEYLKIALKEANLYFSKDNISLKHSDSTNVMAIEVNIDTKEIGNYEFNSEKQECFGFDLKIISSITKHIGKKDSLILSKYENEIEVMIQKIKKIGSTSGISYDTIRNKVIEDHQIEGELPVYEKKPICSILNSEFLDMCKAMDDKKYDRVEVAVYPNGIVFEVNSKNDISKKFHKFGDVGKYDSGEGEIRRIRFGMNIMKSLSKLSNVSSGNNSNIQIFVENDFPLCICSKVGNYGSIRILIRDHL